MPCNEGRVLLCDVCSGRERGRGRERGVGRGTEREFEKIQNCSLDFVSFLIGMLPLLVTIHDDDSHDEEANVSQEDQYHWSKEGPHK